MLRLVLEKKHLACEVVEISKSWCTGQYWFTLDEVLEELEAQLADDLAVLLLLFPLFFEVKRCFSAMDRTTPLCHKEENR